MNSPVMDLNWNYSHLETWS